MLEQSKSTAQRPAVAHTPAEPINWDDLRFFLEVLRSQSLTTAARRLGVTQSTVGRRLASLEARLGARLLRRTRAGYVSTEAGEVIRERVEHIDHEAQCIERMVGGLDRRLSGSVRVAAPVLLANHKIAPLLATLRLRYPDLELELCCVTDAPDAIPAGTEIALQLAPFVQPELVARRLGLLAFGFYASCDYLECREEPRFENGCAGHDLIALSGDGLLPDEVSWLAGNARMARPALRTNSRETQIWATARGGGLALLPCFRADAFPELKRLAPFSATPVAEVWVAIQGDSRRVPRVRAVVECIAEALQRDSEPAERCAAD